MSFIDFEYNGLRLSDFGWMVCTFGGASGTETVSAGNELNLNTIYKHSTHKFELMSTSYSAPFSISFQICKHPCERIRGGEQYFENNEINKLMRWLNKKGYYKFKTINSDGQSGNIYYKGTFNTIKKIKIGSDVVGLELTFTANAPFGYYEPLSYEMDFSNVSDEFVIYDSSDEIGYIYPNTLKIEVLEDGDLQIKNSQESNVVEVKNCIRGEIITLNGENKIILSDKEHPTLCNDFNYNFVKIINKCGESNDYYEVDNEDDEVKNIFTVTLPCNIYLSYSPICKTGEI